MRVRVTGADGSVSDWSDPAIVERGLDAGDWQAVADRAWSPTERGPAALLRREFTVDGDDRVGAAVRDRARDLRRRDQRPAGGRRRPGAGVDQLPPPAALPGLRRDRPAAARARTPSASTVADGWWRGRLGFVPGARDTYGTSLGLLAQLEITRADGSRTVIGTDGDLALRDRPGPRGGPVRRRALRRHQGAARLVAAGVRRLRVVAVPGRRARPRDAGGAGRAAGARHRGPAPSARRSPRRRAGPSSTSARTWSAGCGSGSAAARGATVTMRHAEVLEDGELGGRARCAPRGPPTRYTLRGDPGGEEWEPRVHLPRLPLRRGHRLARRLTARPCPRSPWCTTPTWSAPAGSTAPTTLLTRLHDNVVWGMRGNFVDVPTDCPQRDERLGWTGDLQVFAPTATYLYDCAGFLASWLKDLAADQAPDGDGAAVRAARRLPRAVRASPRRRPAGATPR